jgi:hypothetical protein
MMRVFERYESTRPYSDGRRLNEVAFSEKARRTAARDLNISASRTPRGFLFDCPTRILPFDGVPAGSTVSRTVEPSVDVFAARHSAPRAYCLQSCAANIPAYLDQRLPTLMPRWLRQGKRKVRTPVIDGAILPGVLGRLCPEVLDDANT